MDATAKHSVSVAGIIVDDQGRALLIRRMDTGEWEPPGGVLELDESIEDGLRREVLEETGIEVKPERLTGVYKNMPQGIVALVFRCSAVAGAPSLGPETKELAWFSAEQVVASLPEAYAVRVLDAIDESDTPPEVRTHDGRTLIP